MDIITRMKFVELSYTTGVDLQSIQTANDIMIQQHYENLRSQRSEYLDNVWYPRFLENWKENGELVAIAAGDKIWSTSEDTLIPTPAGTDPAENIATLNDWVAYAHCAYEDKEKELIEELNKNEWKSRSSANESFEQMIEADATI